MTPHPTPRHPIRRFLSSRHTLTALGVIGGVLGIVASRHSIAWLGTVGACLAFYVAAMHQQTPAREQPRSGVPKDKFGRPLPPRPTPPPPPPPAKR